MEAATTAFLRNGYLGTSMDEIAALTSVSKQTVYRHFADKQRLFTDIILATSDQVVGELVEHAAGALPETGDVEKDLGQLARQLIAATCQPEVLRLRRLVIGEAARFPELAAPTGSAASSGCWPPWPTSCGVWPTAGCSSWRTRSSPPTSSPGWSCGCR